MLGAVGGACELTCLGRGAGMGVRAHVCPGPFLHVCAQACVTGAGPPCDHRLTHASASLPTGVKSSPFLAP